MESTQAGCLRCGKKQKIWEKTHLPLEANGDVLAFCSRDCKEKTVMKEEVRSE